MSGNASSLVAEAKKWASYYGSYPNGWEGAVLTVPLRIRAAWESNDADAFADIFAENGSLLVDDDQLRGREEIRSYMAAAFEGPYRGTRLIEEPLEIRPIGSDSGVALAITQGGVVRAGETAVAPESEVRSTWVITNHGGDWSLFSLQSSPVKG